MDTIAWRAATAPTQVGKAEEVSASASAQEGMCVGMSVSVPSWKGMCVGICVNMSSQEGMAMQAPTASTAALQEEKWQLRA
eukprot:1158009-Pelagomonas_calceolata.AAC.2